MKTQIAIALLGAFVLATSACAKSNTTTNPESVVAAPAASTVVAEDQDGLDELDPFDPNVEGQLKQMDQAYEQETGVSAHLPSLNFFSTGCRREACAVYARVEKSEQRLYLYVNGSLYATYATSTGIPGRGTPDFDTHPDGRIYDHYTSTKFPGGDYNGLGNMPYAVFISGGFAIHGTGKSNWPKLGRVASHGCVRIHPDNAHTFNSLVRQYGAANTWITVE